MSTSRMASFEVLCENSDVNSEKERFDDSFCETYQRNNKVKMIGVDRHQQCVRQHEQYL